MAGRLSGRQMERRGEVVKLLTFIHQESEKGEGLKLSFSLSLSVR